MLDRIKPAVKVWWSSVAQNTQILQSGEVDMTDTWGARAYAESVVPEPQRRGLFRAKYSGAMLRDHLGLGRPANQFTHGKEKPKAAE